MAARKEIVLEAAERLTERETRTRIFRQPFDLLCYPHRRPSNWVMFAITIFSREDAMRVTHVLCLLTALFSVPAVAADVDAKQEVQNMSIQQGCIPI